jgi:SAM-dependent methyltransferase
MTLKAFPPEYFGRYDDSDDALFYNFPRKVVHIDDFAITIVRRLFDDLLPPGGVYLDLMSSWRSHIPEQLQPAEVVGLGMNAEEMADNPQLDRYVVQNLNQNPTLPFEDNQFDAAICTVSVQYLTQPVEVFSQVNRVLKPGGVFMVSFSNRCFMQKAVAVWLGSSDNQHLSLVVSYFENSGGWVDLNAYHNVKEAAEQGGDPLFAVWGRKQAQQGS